MKTILSLENFNNGVEFTFSNGKEEMEIINFLVENGLDCDVVKTPNSFRKRSIDSFVGNVITTKITHINIENIMKEEFIKQDANYCVINSIKDDAKHISIWFSDLDSVINIAKKKNAIVATKPNRTEQSEVTYYFNPNHNVYQKKTIFINKVKAVVTEDKYKDCLEEVLSQKQEDRSYSYIREDEYYNPANWCFDTKTDDIVKIIS